MTLLETKDGHTVVHEDSATYNANKWAKIIGCGRDAFIGAAHRGGATIIKIDPTISIHNTVREWSVADFPNIITGFSQAFIPGPDGNTYLHPWARGVDTSVNFEVSVPSETKLVYVFSSKQSSNK